MEDQQDFNILNQLKIKPAGSYQQKLIKYPSYNQFKVSSTGSY